MFCHTALRVGRFDGTFLSQLRLAALRVKHFHEVMLSTLRDVQTHCVHALFRCHCRHERVQAARFWRPRTALKVLAAHCWRSRNQREWRRRRRYMNKGVCRIARVAGGQCVESCGQLLHISKSSSFRFFQICLEFLQLFPLSPSEFEIYERECVQFSENIPR